MVLYDGNDASERRSVHFFLSGDSSGHGRIEFRDPESQEKDLSLLEQRRDQRSSRQLWIPGEVAAGELFGQQPPSPMRREGEMK